MSIHNETFFINAGNIKLLFELLNLSDAPERNASRITELQETLDIDVMQSREVLANLADLLRLLNLGTRRRYFSSITDITVAERTLLNTHYKTMAKLHHPELPAHQSGDLRKKQASIEQQLGMSTVDAQRASMALR